MVWDVVNALYSQKILVVASSCALNSKSDTVTLGVLAAFPSDQIAGNLGEVYWLK